MENTSLYSAIGSRKVAIVGSGFVGSSIAYALTIRDLAREIVLIDINSERAKGEALDIQHGISYMGASSVRVGTYEDCANCDLIIITAGRPRRNGETRLDMISDNIGIMRNTVNEIQKYYTRGVILVVSNPVDILTHKTAEWMQLPEGRVFGTGCILDSSRLIRRIADYTKINTAAIKCDVVGEHGDTQFPVWSKLAIAGIPMQEYCDNVGLEWGPEKQEKLYTDVRSMGATIIAAKGRTHYGIATCVCSLADAILNQRLTIAPITSPLHGEYGIHDVSISLPSIIGVNGVEHHLEEKWTDREVELIRYSADKMKETLKQL